MNSGHDISDQTVAQNTGLKGTATSPGIAVGTAFLFNTDALTVSDRKIGQDDIETERKKVESAIRIVDLELRKLSEMSETEANSTEARSIIDFHREILKDPEVLDSIYSQIESDLKPAERAVYDSLKSYMRKLRQTENQLFIERIADIREVRDRLVRSIKQKKLIINLNTDHVVVSREISPSEVLLFARKNVKAMVSERGGLTSHASIIANSVGIPFVIGVDGVTDKVTDGQMIVVNGNSGEITINPDENYLNEVEEKVKCEKIRAEKMQVGAKKPAATKCGRRVVVQANVELEAELDRVVENHAEGIGLLRTEPFFWENNDNGSESSSEIRHRQFLEKAARTVGDSEITIRLFDVGGDKLPGHNFRENNPFLGWRGVRILLDRPALLRNQIALILESLSRTETRFNIMVPMISDLSEVLEVKKILNEEIARIKMQEGRMKFGIMIEVPSAAVMADKLAPHVDFFSIGTNDLTQYTLAADRTNTKVQKLYNPMHPAVWRLIRMAAVAGKKSGTSTTVCGELASDAAAACLLVGLGIDKLSMNAASIPAVKHLLRKFDYKTLQKRAEAVLESQTAEEASHIKANLLKEAEEIK